MKLKELSEKSGISERTIRYYISDGVFVPEKYTENYSGRKNYDYTENDLIKLEQIALLRKYDFSIKEIKSLFDNELDIQKVLSEHIEDSKKASEAYCENIIKMEQTLNKKPKNALELCNALSTPVVEETPLPAIDEQSAYKVMYTKTKKSNKKLIAIVCIIAIISCILTTIVIRDFTFAEKNEKGYLLTAASERYDRTKSDNAILIYDIKNDTETEYKVKGYSEVFSLNKYIGGQFACIGISDNEEKNIILFNNGKMEAEVPVTFDNQDRFVVYNGHVYYLIGDEIIEQDTKTYKIKSFAQGVQYFDISEEGKMAYISTDRKTLYVDNKNFALDNYYTEVYWAEEDVLILKNSKGYVVYSVNKHKEKPVHVMEDVLYIHAIKGSALICEEADTSPGDVAGNEHTSLIDIRKNVKKTSFFRGKWYSEGSCLWLDEKPVQ